MLIKSEAWEDLHNGAACKNIYMEYGQCPWSAEDAKCGDDYLYDLEQKKCRLRK